MKKLVVSFLVIILLTPLSYNLNQNISLNNQVYEKNENNLNFENSSYNFKIIEEILKLIYIQDAMELKKKFLF